MTGRLDIDPEELGPQAGVAAKRQGSSTPRPVPPASTGGVGSMFDAVAAAIATTTTQLMQIFEARNHAAATKQAGMLAEAPAQIADQDSQGATQMAATPPPPVVISA